MWVWECSVLPLPPCKVPDVTTITTLTYLCSSLPQRSVQTTKPVPSGIVSLLLLTFTYILAVALDIYTQGRFNNHAAHSLYRIMITTSCVMGVMKMGNIVPRMTLEPTSLAFQPVYYHYTM